MISFEIGKSYTFNTNAPAILGEVIENAKLISVLDYETALSYINVDLEFRKIYPILPLGLPDNPETSVYYRFLTQSGEKIVLADLWILAPTVLEVSGIDFTINFTNGTLADISFLKDTLNSFGYTNFTIKKV